jgi:F-type H+-transporting ATPase subunit epsilon
MADAMLACTVVTPERAIFDDEAEMIVVPAHDGEIGILPGHAELLAKLGVGELRISAKGMTERFFVDGGFVQVADNRVTVLTDSACAVNEIDVDGAEDRVKKLRGALRGEELSAANHRLLAMKRVQARLSAS